MDLTQSKLSRQEWESIESPVSTKEKQILKLIIDGFDDVSLRSNATQTIFSLLKIEKTPEFEGYLYNKYFAEPINAMLAKVKPALDLGGALSDTALKKMKSADMIRLQNTEKMILQNKSDIFEFFLIDVCEKLIKNHVRPENYTVHLYTLIHLRKINIQGLNSYVVEFVNKLVTFFTTTKTQPSDIVFNAYECIERNANLFRYEDIKLFPHQKQLFTVAKSYYGTPKLIMYTAPTGTGKTLSPIGLSSHYRVIFVCVARHIGLALAKSAISMEKRVAFAFGCETASDIRLHYYSAVNYVKNKRSGGIGKVDNSEGSKVEIMICDVQSYLTAMYYMISFNKDTSTIITYWDEPTITMDYETHDLHNIIHRNWSENKIPNMVLSCATLPKEDEIAPVICDFKQKFESAEVHTITSFDCRKSIPILNKDGYSVLPHLLYENHSELISCVAFCEESKTMLRYFDLKEIIQFIRYVNENLFVSEDYLVDTYFADGSFERITMDSIKVYYLTLLRHVNEGVWPMIYRHLKINQTKKYSSVPLHKSKSMESVSTSRPLVRLASVSSDNVGVKTAKSSSSGVLVTTADAYTLTDGPTIFLTEDVKKIGNFYIQQSQISPIVFQSILSRISINSELGQRIDTLERVLQEKQEKSFDDTSKTHKSGGLIQKSNSGKSTSSVGESDRLSNESQKMMDEINRLRGEVLNVTIDPKYVPNSRPHQEIWTPTCSLYPNAFVSNIDEDTAKTIMTLEIENHLKVLLMLGIGLFIEGANIHYMELMKRLATNQQLFIIIASSDYIYGTNYSFAHGFIAKDLTNMTQQKTLQAMGRIGRNSVQQDYTVRFRDDDMILNLFQRQVENREANNMVRLFSTDE